MRSAASNLKNVTLECGGKSPLLIFEDADLDEAVKWAHAGIMDNSGQVCTSTSRIHVHKKVYQQFVDQFVRYTKKKLSWAVHSTRTLAMDHKSRGLSTIV